MTGITITEALAEIKTIAKRISKKQDFIGGYLARQDGVRDPLEKDGGSAEVIKTERQAIRDLETRTIALRRGIQKANDNSMVTINGTSRTISEWLTWRRDVAPGQKAFLTKLVASLNSIRDQARKQGAQVTNAVGAASITETKPTDIVVNIDELAVAKELEELEDVLGQLDGQLSLKNATLTLAD